MAIILDKFNSGGSADCLIQTQIFPLYFNSSITGCLVNFYASDSTSYSILQALQMFYITLHWVRFGRCKKTASVHPWPSRPLLLKYAFRLSIISFLYTFISPLLFFIYFPFITFCLYLLICLAILIKSTLCFGLLDLLCHSNQLDRLALPPLSSLAFSFAFMLLCLPLHHFSATSYMLLSFL